MVVVFGLLAKGYNIYIVCDLTGNAVDETMQQQHLNQYIKFIYIENVIRLVTTRNLIWRVVFLFFCSWWAADAYIIFICSTDIYIYIYKYILYIYINAASEGRSTVNYCQSSALDCPYLSCNDHCDRWLFHEVSFININFIS